MFQSPPTSGEASSSRIFSIFSSGPIYLTEIRAPNEPSRLASSWEQVPVACCISADDWMGLTKTPRHFERHGIWDIPDIPCTYVQRELILYMVFWAFEVCICTEYLNMWTSKWQEELRLTHGCYSRRWIQELNGLKAELETHGGQEHCQLSRTSTSYSKFCSVCEPSRGPGNHWEQATLNLRHWRAFDDCLMVSGLISVDHWTTELMVKYIEFSMVNQHFMRHRFVDG